MKKQNSPANMNKKMAMMYGLAAMMAYDTQYTHFKFLAMDITEEQYSKACQIVNQYKLQQREKHLEGLKKPCPGCGGKTNENGDCRKCGIVYLNSVHQIKNCTKFHTHGNGCYVPFEGWEKFKVSDHKSVQ